MQNADLVVSCVRVLCVSVRDVKLQVFYCEYQRVLPYVIGDWWANDTGSKEVRNPSRRCASASDRPASLAILLALDTCWAGLRHFNL